MIPPACSSVTGLMMLAACVIGITISFVLINSNYSSPSGSSTNSVRPSLGEGDDAPDRDDDMPRAPPNSPVIDPNTLILTVRRHGQEVPPTRIMLPLYDPVPVPRAARNREARAPFDVDCFSVTAG